MHVIVDGSDNLGKTTILNMLSEKLQLPIIKMPNMQQYIGTGDAEVFSQLFNETVIQFAQFPFLLDRGYSSSEVYSKVFGREYDFGYLKNTKSTLSPKIIILTGRYVITEYGKKPRVKYSSFCKDPIFDEEQKNMIDEEFCEYARINKCPLIRVHGKTVNQVFEEVLIKIYE